MNIITSYFVARALPGAIQIGIQQGIQPTAERLRQRQDEFIRTLWTNTLSPHVEAVHLHVEGEEALGHLRTHVLDHAADTAPRSSSPLCWTREQCRKIIPILHLSGAPPSYADLFGYANQVLHSKAAMVCNADVHFSVSLEASTVGETMHLVSRSGSPLIATRRVALALTRYEVDEPFIPPATVGGEGESIYTRVQRDKRSMQSLHRVAPLISEYRGSHDAFVFEAPLPESFVRCVCHAQNCYQAENIVIYELERAGYVVLNPCLSVRLVHQHAAEVRQWYPSVDPARYSRAPPISLQEAKRRVAGI